MRVAFDGSIEAKNVERFHTSCSDAVSLVAIDGDRIDGNTLFIPVTTEPMPKTVFGVGLAPMVVLPEYQRPWNAQECIRHSLAALRRRTNQASLTITSGSGARGPPHTD